MSASRPLSSVVNNNQSKLSNIHVVSIVEGLLLKEFLACVISPGGKSPCSVTIRIMETCKNPIASRLHCWGRGAHQSNKTRTTYYHQIWFKITKLLLNIYVLEGTSLVLIHVPRCFIYLSVLCTDQTQCPHHLSRSSLFVYGDYCLKVYYGN
jgi:hypothetical protein